MQKSFALYCCPHHLVTLGSRVPQGHADRYSRPSHTPIGCSKTTASSRENIATRPARLGIGQSQGVNKSCGCQSQPRDTARAPVSLWPLTTEAKMPHAVSMPSTGLQALILCGPGSSLPTFTSSPDENPKALLPIANRPMVWYPIDFCYRMGITSKKQYAETWVL